MFVFECWDVLSLFRSWACLLWSCELITPVRNQLYKLRPLKELGGLEDLRIFQSSSSSICRVLVAWVPKSLHSYKFLDIASSGAWSGAHKLKQEGPAFPVDSSSTSFKAHPLHGKELNLACGKINKCRCSPLLSHRVLTLLLYVTSGAGVTVHLMFKRKLMFLGDET